MGIRVLIQVNVSDTLKFSAQMTRNLLSPCFFGDRERSRSSRENLPLGLPELHTYHGALMHYAINSH